MDVTFTGLENAPTKFHPAITGISNFAAATPVIERVSPVPNLSQYPNPREIAALVIYPLLYENALDKEFGYSEDLALSVTTYGSEMRFQLLFRLYVNV